MFTDHDFDIIVDALRALPQRTDPSFRSSSWQTADQLLLLFGPQQTLGNGKDLDADLCARFQLDEGCTIRPAYYPGEDNCKRLWGHVDNVGQGPGRSALRAKLELKPRPLEEDYLGEDAPIVFISHALADHHFAARVRLNLARHGIRSWLAEGEIYEEYNLFEGIEAALGRCDALMILISSLSISSAWIYTEAQTALKAGKKILTLIDASDTQICDMLKVWRNERRKRLAGGKDDNWLNTGEGIRAYSAVLERYKPVASPTRVQKFRKGVELTLDSQTMVGLIAFYPDVPPEWGEDINQWKGFESAINDLAIQCWKPGTSTRHIDQPAPI